jgi:hypothetical protein
MHGWISFTFFAHKVLRWLSPFALVGLLVLNILLLDLPVARWALTAQFAFYGLAVVAAWLPARPRVLRFARLTTLFALMNLALLVGFIRWLTRSQNGAWKRTDREPVPAGGA